MDGPTTRRRFLALIGTAAAASAVAACRRPEPAPAPPPPSSLDRAVGWLRRQSGDGVFRSSTYGFFAEGQSLTPFVTLALLRADVDVDPAGVLSLRAEDGSWGLATSVPDYPVYATSLALTCLRELGAASSSAWLRAQQLLDGWSDTPAHGGFPMGSRKPPKPPHAGHVDLSMTRRAIEALADDDAWDDDARAAARGFVLRCRTDDGGFVYSPVQPMLNKGAGGPASGYGSATCDGLLALLALGAPPDDAIVAAAHAFVVANHRLDANPGLAGGPMAAFGPAMRGYYRAASAEVFARLGGPDGWRATMTSAIEAEQRDDGSFANESPLQKEDDPLVATALAVSALVSARS